MDIVIDVAFVVTVTAFFSQQFALKGWRVLACAFGVTLLFNIAPLISDLLPAFSPWLDAVLRTFWLFVVAAGSVDTIRYFLRPR